MSIRGFAAPSELQDDSFKTAKSHSMRHHPEDGSIRFRGENGGGLRTVHVSLPALLHPASLNREGLGGSSVANLRKIEAAATEWRAIDFTPRGG